MGWDFQHRERGTSNADLMAANLADGYELLDSATVGGVFYGAVRDPQGDVFAQVTLTKWVPSDWFNFGKKDMDESMGPNEARCPDRILDLLTPTTSVWANEWRAKCREHNARVGKVKRGSVLLHAGSRYTAVNLRRNLFRSEDGRLLRWSWWRSSNDFEVVA